MELKLGKNRETGKDGELKERMLSEDKELEKIISILFTNPSSHILVPTGAFVVMM